MEAVNRRDVVKHRDALDPVTRSFKRRQLPGKCIQRCRLLQVSADRNPQGRARFMLAVALPIADEGGADGLHRGDINCEETDMIGRWREADQAGAGNAIEGWFEADDSAVGSRAYNRADSLCAEADMGQPGSDGRRRPAAAAAGAVGGVLRVSRRPRLEIGELGGDGFADDEGAGAFQLRHNSRLFAGKMLRRNARAGPRYEAVDMKYVFDAQQGAIQWRAPRVIGKARLQRCGVAAQTLEAIRFRQEGVDRAVDALEAPLQPVNQIRGRRFPPAQGIRVRHQ